MRRCCLAICLLVLTMAIPCAGHAQSRVALVVGNGAYRNVAALSNPLNDASDISAALRRLNFDVTMLTDARYDDMRRALISFGQKARGAEIAVVYFAGHGMEISGENWLIPIDAKLANDVDVPNESIGMQALMRAVSNSTKLGLVILDSCRNNPFLPGMARTNLTRAVERGLTRVEPADNILVAYAARDGTTANDGSGRNSPFTASLLRNIETPGLEVANLFRTVRQEVMDATNRGQQPFVYGSLNKEQIYLKPVPDGSSAPSPPSPAPAPRPPALTNLTPPPSPAPPAATISPSPSPVISGQPLPPNLTARLTSSLPRSVEGGEDAFIKRLGEISGGRIDVRLFYAGEIVPGLQALDAVSNGTVEMAWSLGEFYYGKDPVFKLLSNIPFGFEPLTHVAWRSQSDVAATIETFLAGYSVFAVPCGLLGRYSDFASRKEIRTVSDLNGMKIRAGNFDGQVLSRLGVVNQQIAAGDIYPSLERRTIDASVWADPHRLEKLALQKVAPNIYYPGSLVPGATIDLFISTGFWKSLGPTGQQYVRQACSDSLVSQNTITLANNQSAVDRMRRDGANIAPLPKDVQRALVKAWDGLAGEISGKNRVFKTLLDSAMLRRNEMLSSSIRQ